MTTDTDLKNVVHSLLAEGNDKNTILTALVAEHGMDIASAGTLFTAAAKDAGYILDRDAREKAINDAYAVGMAGDGGFDRDAAVEALMTAAHISKAAAETSLRRKCDENSVEWPKRQPRTARNHEEIAAVVKGWHEQEFSEAQIKAGLVEHYGYTEKSAEAAYRRYGKMAGFVEVHERNSVDREALVAFMLRSVDLPREEWIAAYMTEMGGSKGAAATRYSHAVLAEEYAAARVA